jgi:hypothetical protein
MAGISYYLDRWGLARSKIACGLVKRSSKAYFDLLRGKPSRKMMPVKVMIRTNRSQSHVRKRLYGRDNILVHTGFDPQISSSRYGEMG